VDRRSVAFDAVSCHSHVVAGQLTVIDNLRILVGAPGQL
jgi:hypothetical protein